MERFKGFHCTSSGKICELLFILIQYCKIFNITLNIVCIDAERVKTKDAGLFSNDVVAKSWN